MHRTTIAVAIVAVSIVSWFSSPEAAKASHSVWLSYQEGAVRAERARDFVLAKTLYIAAMREAAADPAGESTTAFAQSANAVASILVHEGDYAQAEDFIDDVVRLCKTEHELASKEGIAAQMLHAESLFRQGKLGEAEVTLRAALTDIDAIHQGNHPSTALALNNLANVKAAQKQPDEAEAIVRRAIAIAEQPGGDNSHLAASLDTLADILHSRGKTTEAAAIAERALHEAESSLGEGNQLSAGIHETLGQISDSLGQKEEAERHFRKQVAITARHYHADHPLRMQSMGNLRGFLDRGGERGRASEKQDEPSGGDGLTTQPVSKPKD